MPAFCSTEVFAAALQVVTLFADGTEVSNIYNYVEPEGPHLSLFCTSLDSLLIAGSVEIEGGRVCVPVCPNQQKRSYYANQRPAKSL